MSNNYEAVWGHGGILNYATGNPTVNCLLTTGVGNFNYSPVWQRATNWRNKNISKFLGYKVTADISLLNVDEYDYVQFQNLMSILSTMRDNDLTIFPRYVPESGSATPNQRGYNDMIISSDVQIQDGNLLDVFQTIDLKFEKRNLMDSIPANLSYSGTQHTAFEEAAGVTVDWTIENGDEIEIQVF